MSGETGSRRRLTELLLAVCAVLAVLLVAFGAALIHLARVEPTLGQLDPDDRMRLLDEVRRISPPLFESFPGVALPGFYRFAPTRRYDGSHPLAGPTGFFRDHFTTNELGFRAIPVAKASGARRIVIVGDSWVFASGVAHEASFGQQLARFLNEGSPPGSSWEVFNLGMMGWNTQNQIAALRVLRPWLDPDYVIFCVTSNDIDDAFEVWNGALVHGPFQSGGVFRRSYEVERRWVETLRALDTEAQQLAESGVPSALFFLAEWRNLAVFYADKADVRIPYAVVPEAFILDPYLLSVEEDPGRHPNEGGHRRIAGYLHDFLVGLAWTQDPRRREPDFPAPPPAPVVDPDAVAAEFEFWKPFAIPVGAGTREGELLGQESILTIPRAAGQGRVLVDLQLLPALPLYPLRVDLRVLGAALPPTTATFDRYVEGTQTLALPLTDELDDYEFVEVRVAADRVVSIPPRILPAALRITSIRFDPIRE